MSKNYILKAVVVLFCICLLTILVPEVFAGEEGLVGYWNFEDLKKGDTEFSGFSGNERTGKLHNNTHFVEDEFGKALKFDGITDYAEIPFDEGLSCPGAMSFEAWIYPTPPHQADRNGGIVNNLHGENNSRLLVAEKSGMVMAEIYIANEHVRVKGPSALSRSWNHVVYVYDGTQGIIYVNGEPGTPISYSEKVRTGTSSLTIGWGHTGNNYHYSGLIDEVKIYNRALSAKEIKAKYEGSSK